jgi:hypothetical protein
MTGSFGDERASYQILVQGRLESSWAARLGDMALTVHEREGQPTVTELTGWISDQAALMGVLGQLYALGVTVVSVERLKDDAGSRGTQA